MAVAAAGASVLALVRVPRTHDPVAWTHAFDAAHLPVAAGLTFAIAWALGDRVTPRRPALRALAVVAAGVIAVEVVQPTAGRQAEWGDLAAGLIGATLAALTFASSGRARRASAAALLAACLAFAWPALVDVASIRARAARFPTLFSPSAWESPRLWSPVGDDHRADIVRTADGWTLAVEGSRSGLRYEAGGQSWERWPTLVVDAENVGSAPLPVRLRVDSLSDGRLATSALYFTLAPGEGRLEVAVADLVAASEDGRFDASAIDRVHLTTPRAGAAGRLLLRRVWLQREGAAR